MIWGGGGEVVWSCSTIEFSIRNGEALGLVPAICWNFFPVLQYLSSKSLNRPLKGVQGCRFLSRKSLMCTELAKNFYIIKISDVKD